MPSSPYSSLSSWYIKPESPLTWSSLCSYGRIRLDTTVYAYRKISKLTGKIIDRIPIQMPNHVIETNACWINIPKSIQDAYQAWSEKISTSMKLEGASPTKENNDSANRPMKRMKTEPSTSSLPAASSSSSVPIHSFESLPQRSIHAAMHGLNHCMIALMPMSVISLVM